MSQENVEIVRRMHEVVGTEAALGCFDPEVVMIPTPSGPDAAAPYVGYDALIVWVRDFARSSGLSGMGAAGSNQRPLACEARWGQGSGMARSCWKARGLPEQGPRATGRE